MRHTIAFFIVGLVLLSACLDIELLDEMQRWTTDPNDTNASSTDDAQGEGTDEAYVPRPDPQDTTAPVVISTFCASSETTTSSACLATGPFSLSLRFASDELAVVSLDESQTGLELRMLSKDYSLEHHALVTRIAGPGPVFLSLMVKDASGNVSKLELETELPSREGIAITEVLADPLGTEPYQEFVEVENLTAAPIDLSGWMIDDNADSNGDSLPAGSVLAPHAVALVVGPGFDREAADVPISTPLFFLTSSIGSAGLRNDPPESVELYDATGTKVSVYPGTPQSPTEGCSIVRVDPRLPDGVPGGFIPEPSRGSTPGIPISM